jgi:hypothetical protein
LGAQINFSFCSFLLIFDKMMFVIKSLFKHWGLPFFGIIFNIDNFSNIYIPFFCNVIKLNHFFLWVVWLIFIIYRYKVILRMIKTSSHSIWIKES